MAIFLVLPASNPAAVKAELQKNGMEFIDLPAHGHFVSFRGTSEELSNALGITDGKSGTGVVTLVTSYYGRLPTNIWDWVKSRWEA